MWPNWTIPDTSTARTNAWLRRRRCRASLGTLDEKHWVVYNLLQDIGFTMSYHIICNRRIESSNIRLKAIVFTINIWVYPMSGPIWRRCLKKWWENKMRTYLHYIYIIHICITIYIYDYMILYVYSMYTHVCTVHNMHNIRFTMHINEHSWQWIQMGISQQSWDEYQGFNSGQPSHKMASGTWMETSTYSQPNPNNPSIWDVKLSSRTWKVML